MRTETKIDILLTKLSVRYKVDKDKIEIIRSGTDNKKGDIMLLEVKIQDDGRMTQLSISEMDSLNKKIYFHNTAIIISRIDENGRHVWTQVTYFNEKGGS